MRILLDHNIHAGLRLLFTDDTVSTAREMGWSDLSNGNLLSAAEFEFDVFVTADKNLPFQTKLAGRQIAVLVLDVPNLKLNTLKRFLNPIEREMQKAVPGTATIISPDVEPDQPK